MYPSLIHQFLEDDWKALGKGRGRDSSLSMMPGIISDHFQGCNVYSVCLDLAYLGWRALKPPGDLGAQWGLGSTDASGTSRHTGGIYKNPIWRPRDVKWSGSGHRGKEREVAKTLLCFRAQPRALWAGLPEAGPGICPGHGETAYLTRASNDYSGSGGFGADKRCTGKGRGGPFKRGQQSLLPQSIVLSFLQQDARSPTEKGLVCLHSQHNNLLLAFLLGLAQSNRIQSLPGKKEGKEGGREWLGLRISRPSAWTLNPKKDPELWGLGPSLGASQPNWRETVFSCRAIF